MEHSTLDPEIAFDIRCEARDARKLARLQALGYTHAFCPRCGDIRSLNWAGWGCNNVDDTTADGVCEGVYRAAGGAA